MVRTFSTGNKKKPASPRTILKRDPMEAKIRQLEKKIENLNSIGMQDRKNSLIKLANDLLSLAEESNISEVRRTA